MNLHELIQYVLKDLGPSLSAVLPELSLCAAIVLLLLARMIVPARMSSGLPYYITFLGAWARCCYAAPTCCPGRRSIRENNIRF